MEASTALPLSEVSASAVLTTIKNKVSQRSKEDLPSGRYECRYF